VGSTIIGATVTRHPDETLAAVDMTLSEALLTRCAEIQKQLPYPLG
jgi:hypothetical protein